MFPPEPNKVPQKNVSGKEGTIIWELKELNEIVGGSMLHLSG